MTNSPDPRFRLSPPPPTGCPEGCRPGWLATMKGTDPVYSFVPVAPGLRERILTDGRFSAAVYRSRRTFGSGVFIPTDDMDEIRSTKGWVFLRNGGDYLGIRSSLPASWLHESSDGRPSGPPFHELWTFGRLHVWYAVVGGDADDGTFDDFASRWALKNLAIRRRRIVVTL